MSPNGVEENELKYLFRWKKGSEPAFGQILWWKKSHLGGP